MTDSSLASLVVEYRDLSDAKYLTKLDTILACTKGATNIFGVFPPDGSPEKLEEQRNKFKEAYEAAQDGSKKMKDLRKSTRSETDKVLYTMGHHIQSKCGGNVEHLMQSGFDIRQPRPPRGPRPTPAPATPTELTIEAGEHPGQIKVKVARARRAISVEIWSTTGDPSNDANWQYRGVFCEFETVVNGFQSGTRYNLRVRFVGKGGPSGWSNVISIMAP